VTRPFSVRTRLALWHGAALLIVVSVYAVAVFLQMRDDLYESLDGQLAGDHALAAQWLSQGTGSRGAMSLDTLPGSAARQADVPWVDAWSADGRRVFDAGRQPPLPPPDGPPASWAQGPRTVRLDGGQRARVLIAPTPVAGASLFVRVGRSEGFARQEMGEFAAALALSLPVAFAVAALAAYVLARRALAPVAAMTARARQITADHLDGRLPVENRGDEFGQLAGVVNDLLARLERAFETLRRFTGDAAHELRTPLTAIRSVGEVGLREPRSEAEYREILGSILEEVDRLATVTDSLLLLSRADSGKADLRPALVDLAGLARDVADDLQVLAEEKGVALAVARGPEAVTAWADGDTLRRAVVNLLDNAIKFTPEGGAVRLSARRVGADAILDVVDSGPGIAAEHLPFVFDRFYRADAGRARSTRGGAGLGLAIARWAVDANGGRIEVESAPGRGSTFRIVLPQEADGVINQGRRS
jgi:heavy metal sensor kinase